MGDIARSSGKSDTIIGTKWIECAARGLGKIIVFSILSFAGMSLATGQATQTVVTGAEQLDLLLPKIRSKRVALVVNYTAIVGKTHLADTLKKHDINIRKIFSPEHGFRGAAADGEEVNDTVDVRTGIPLVSLYGKHFKPTSEELTDVDQVLFDIQDVGARFYTYISTLHYVMEACAENGKTLIVLDRPDPNGYVDGPILQSKFKSFVGMHPIPVVHGMTVGELAQMINGQGWLDGGKKCVLDIIKVKNWKHDDVYHLPVKPSPNLPNDQAVLLYPSLCFFEGTAISVGRGTRMPFQVIGSPKLTSMKFEFTPVSIPGMSTHPPLENRLCYGMDLRTVAVPKKIDLSYLLTFYKSFPEKDKFFTSYFTKLAGNETLKQQVIDGLTEDQIRSSWKADLDAYKIMRKKYLLYP